MFLHACHAPTQQIRVLLRVWDQLSGNGGPDGLVPIETSRPTPGNPAPPELFVTAEPPEDRYKVASAAMHAVGSLAREMRHAYQAAAYEHGEPGIEVFLDIDGAVHLPGVHGTGHTHLRRLRCGRRRGCVGAARPAHRLAAAAAGRCCHRWTTPSPC
ncbi:hypothetical protein [Nocardia sp. NPDC051981]|uniref:hypothetical protein n=1 Tax=Nocardia sp. NPDC051981 TaxID=3155417 RepID=UPI003449F5E1